MNVKELVKKLEKYPDECEVVVDLDENGYYSLEKVKLALDEERNFQLVNLISSNEA